MHDQRILLTGLTAYRDSLDKHLVSLREDFARIRSSWNALREFFHGNAADEFEPVWEGTLSAFQHYQEDGARIRQVLAQRIESLEDFERTGSLG